MTTEVVQKDYTAQNSETNDVAAGERTRSSSFRPRFDIWETENELVLCGDLPGVAPEDLEIRFENRELAIYGKVPARQENTEFLYGEYRIGDFFRTFTIGEVIDAERISAEMKDGVLTLHLPKAEAVKPRRIEVKAV